MTRIVKSDKDVLAGKNAAIYYVTTDVRQVQQVRMISLTEKLVF